MQWSAPVPPLLYPPARPQRPFLPSQHPCSSGAAPWFQAAGHWAIHLPAHPLSKGRRHAFPAGRALYAAFLAEDGHLMEIVLTAPHGAELLDAGFSAPPDVVRMAIARAVAILTRRLERRDLARQGAGREDRFGAVGVPLRRPPGRGPAGGTAPVGLCDRACPGFRHLTARQKGWTRVIANVRIGGSLDRIKGRAAMRGSGPDGTVNPWDQTPRSAISDAGSRKDHLGPGPRRIGT